MKISKSKLQEMIKQALVSERYVPREVLDWTQATEKKAKELKELLEYTLDNAEDYPEMKREPMVRQALSTIRRNTESFGDLEQALKVLYDSFVKESRK